MKKQKPDESETENNRWEMCCEWNGGEKKQRLNEREARNNR